MSNEQNEPQEVKVNQYPLSLYPTDGKMQCCFLIFPVRLYPKQVLDAVLIQDMFLGFIWAVIGLYYTYYDTRWWYGTLYMCGINITQCIFAYSIWCRYGRILIGAGTSLKRNYCVFSFIRAFNYSVG